MNYLFIIPKICQTIGDVMIMEIPIAEVEAPEGPQLYFHRTEIMGEKIYLLLVTLSEITTYNIQCYN